MVCFGFFCQKSAVDAGKEEKRKLESELIIHPLLHLFRTVGDRVKDETINLENIYRESGGKGVVKRHPKIGEGSVFHQ